MKMDYRRDLQHNYLVAEDGEDTENYITRMMTENQVQGLLQVLVQLEEYLIPADRICLDSETMIVSASLTSLIPTPAR